MDGWIKYKLSQCNNATQVVENYDLNYITINCLSTISLAFKNPCHQNYFNTLKNVVFVSLSILVNTQVYVYKTTKNFGQKICSQMTTLLPSPPYQLTC